MVTRPSSSGEASGRGKMYSSAVEPRWVPLLLPECRRRPRGTSRRTAPSTSSWPGCMKDEHDAALRLVGDVVADDGDLPGLRLGLGGRDAPRARRRRAPARRSCCPRRSSSAIRSSSARPARGQPGEQRPAQVRCRRPAPRGRATRRAAPRGRRAPSSLCAAAAKAAREGELVVAARLGLLQQPAQRPAPTSPCSSARLAGRGEVVDGLGGVGRDPARTRTRRSRRAMLPSTSATKSVARISASRVMSHAAPQHSARASESSSRERPPTTVSSDRSSSRILA